MTLLIACLAGVLIGLSLGLLGSGGSILAVPVLVYGLGQDPVQATTGSLVVVGATATLGAVAAHRAGTIRIGRGLAFGALATGGAVLGARLAVGIDPDLLLVAFGLVMFLAGSSMLWRLRPGAPRPPEGADLGPLVRFKPQFMCRCPQVLKVLVTATAVGLVTGFLGVGGGFLVVPALVLALSLQMREAAGTSLVVISVTTLVALLARAGSGASPDWAPVLVLTGSAVAGVLLGTHRIGQVEPRRLQAAFSVLVLTIAVVTMARSVPLTLA